MKEKVWNIPSAAAIPDELIQAGYTPLLAAILAFRGIVTAKAASAFLDGDSDTLADPLLLTDIMPAIGRITRARQLGEKAAVYGDYDVDGITAACLLTEYLRGMGLDTALYIPDRLEEGYGLNTGAIQRLHEAGVTLIVTVDCGVTAIEETKFSSSIGVDMIITDHHECREELPDAVAVVDPKRPDCFYPSRDLAGVGVAFKLVCAMDGDARRMLDRYADLVAVGTIADVMPLTGENRCMIKAGLEKLRTNPRPGLAALMTESGVDPKRLGAMTVGFTLAPRINAAGRLGRVEQAAALMMEHDPRKSSRLAAELCDMNHERQRLELETWKQAISMLDGTTPSGPIVLAGEGWHQGVIGIAASRLSEAFCVPSVMISLEGDKGKGSCRSYGGFNLFDALSSCGELLESFGGHALAAGLNIRRENVDAFRKALNEYYVNHTPETVDGLPLDMEVYDPGLLTLECVESLEMLEPCGNGNPRPALCMLGAKLSAVTPIGGGKHVRLRIEKFGQSYECVWFSHRAEDLELSAGDWVDLAFYPQVSEFRSRHSVQLLILDLRRTNLGGLCRRILAGDEPEGGICLSRADLAEVWRALESFHGAVSALLSRLQDLDGRLSPGKIALSLRVFREVGLVAIKAEGEELEITQINQEGKADLEHSPAWRRFRA
jgi:single-stranded-DNA-specific exonuclease